MTNEHVLHWIKTVRSFTVNRLGSREKAREMTLRLLSALEHAINSVPPTVQSRILAILEGKTEKQHEH